MKNVRGVPKVRKAVVKKGEYMPLRGGVGIGYCCQKTMIIGPEFLQVNISVLISLCLEALIGCWRLIIYQS